MDEKLPGPWPEQCFSALYKSHQELFSTVGAECVWAEKGGEAHNKVVSDMHVFSTSYSPKYHPKAAAFHAPFNTDRVLLDRLGHPDRATHHNLTVPTLNEVLLQTAQRPRWHSQQRHGITSI